MEKRYKIIIGVVVVIVLVIVINSTTNILDSIGELTGLVVGARNCEDTDGDLTIEEQAFVSGYVEDSRIYKREASNKVITTIYDDKCNIRKTTVLEHYCSNNIKTSIELECEKGCSAGACNPV